MEVVYKNAAARESSVYVYQLHMSLVAQELDNRINLRSLRKFCMPTFGVSVLEQNRLSTSVECAVLVFIRNVLI